MALSGDPVCLGVGQGGPEPGRVGVGEVVRHRALRLQGRTGAGRGNVQGLVHGQRMLMTVWVVWSWVEIICALAWKLRCAVIMLTSCSVRSTVDDSSEPDWIWPKSEVSGAPVRAPPEAWVSAQALLPCDCRPCGLTKVDRATCPSAVSAPLE